MGAQKAGTQYLTKLREIKDTLAMAQKIADQIDIYDMRNMIEEAMDKPDTVMAGCVWAVESYFVHSLVRKLEEMQWLIEERLKLWEGNDEE
ncbi:MAG: hypothetical protein QXT84_02040 [Candidatus Bathyarchaeia archaeon]